MFRITEDPLSGRLVQYLAKNYKNDSIVSVDMDKVGVQNCGHNCRSSINVCNEPAFGSKTFCTNLVFLGN